MKAFQRKEKANCQVHDKVMLKPEKTHIHMSNRSFPKRPKKGKPSTRISRLGKKKLALFFCTRFFASFAFQKNVFSTKRPFSFKVKPENVKLKAFRRKAIDCQNQTLKCAHESVSKKRKSKLSSRWQCDAQARKNARSHVKPKLPQATQKRQALD